MAKPKAAFYWCASWGGCEEESKRERQSFPRRRGALVDENKPPGHRDAMKSAMRNGLCVLAPWHELLVNPAPILILGLGNDLLKDDAAGIRVVEKLKGIFPGSVEVRATSRFGLSLMDELLGREKVLLIDSYLPENFPGASIQEWTLDDAGVADAVAPHFAGLAEVCEAMRQVGCDFPSEVRILAVPVLDPITFSEAMNPQVAALIPEAAVRAARIVTEWLSVPAR